MVSFCKISLYQNLSLLKYFDDASAMHSSNLEKARELLVRWWVFARLELWTKYSIPWTRLLKLIDKLGSGSIHSTRECSLRSRSGGLDSSHQQFHDLASFEFFTGHSTRVCFSTLLEVRKEGKKKDLDPTIQHDIMSYSNLTSQKSWSVSQKAICSHLRIVILYWILSLTETWRNSIAMSCLASHVGEIMLVTHRPWAMNPIECSCIHKSRHSGLYHVKLEHHVIFHMI